MKKLIINLLIGGILAYVGYMLLEKSSTVVSKSAFETQEKLCSDSEMVFGVLQDSVTEITLEIGSTESTSYELKYAYNVNGKNYYAKKKVNDLETQTLPQTKVWYLKSDPKVNTVDDPCPHLESLKAGKTIGNEMLYLIPGAILGLIGLGIAWGGIKGFIAGLFRGNKQA